MKNKKYFNAIQRRRADLNTASAKSLLLQMFLVAQKERRKHKLKNVKKKRTMIGKKKEKYGLYFLNLISFRSLLSRNR